MVDCCFVLQQATICEKLALVVIFVRICYNKAAARTIQQKQQSQDDAQQ